MTDEPSNVSGSIEADEAGILQAEMRAMTFAKNLLYSAQFSEVLPLIQEVEEYEHDDPRVQLINRVLDEAIESFPFSDWNV